MMIKRQGFREQRIRDKKQETGDKGQMTKDKEQKTRDKKEKWDMEQGLRYDD